MFPDKVRNKTILGMTLVLVTVGMFFCGTATASFIPASSPRVKTMGRWVSADNGSLQAGRGAVIASVEFEGTGVRVQMFSDSQGDVWWLKKLDDGPLTRFKAHMGLNMLYQNVPYGKHTLTLIRETEGMRGVTILRGFSFIGEEKQVSDSVLKDKADKMHPVPVAGTKTARMLSDSATETNVEPKTDAPVEGSQSLKTEDKPVGEPRELHRRSIEIIGDSVAAGAFIYPDGDYFQRESGYLAFGPRLARMLGVDWSCIASSGEGAVRNNKEKAPYTATHADEQIERAFYTQKEPLWNNQMDDPELVILAYGENDFNDAIHRPSDEYFKEQYKKLILKLRRFRPNSVIFCMTPANAVTSQRSAPGMGGAVAELQAEGDEKVYFIDLNANGPLLEGTDFLDGVHPLASGHEKMALYLREQVRTILGWE